MSLFGSKLNDVESRLFDNLKKTKTVFPDETLQLEVGLDLMRDLTRISQEAVQEYPKKPNLFTNLNLFARNRELLLNAYISLLFSSYGTQFVILRTVLENNNLMRLFNKNPQYAFEWLPQYLQNRFPQETKEKFGKTGKRGRKFKAYFVRDGVYNALGTEKVRSDIKAFYDDLCNYTHPNSVGWQELVVRTPQAQELILNMPRFQGENADCGVGVALFSMQTTFKAFVETFKGYLTGFAFQLWEWQKKNLSLLLKYQPVEKN